MGSSVRILDDQNLLNSKLSHQLDSELYQISQLAPYGSEILLKIFKDEDTETYSVDLKVSSHHFNFNEIKTISDLDQSVLCFTENLKLSLGKWKRQRFDNNLEQGHDAVELSEDQLEIARIN